MTVVIEVAQVYAQGPKLSKLQGFHRELWCMHFAWPSHTCVQGKCTPVSVYMYCRTWHQPGLSRRFETKQKLCTELWLNIARHFPGYTHKFGPSKMHALPWAVAERTLKKTTQHLHNNFIFLYLKI